MAKNQRGIGIAMSYISVGIGLFTTIFYTALVNKVLGIEAYGAYAWALSIIQYLSLLQLGLYATFTRFYSRLRADNDEQGLDELNGLFLMFYLIIAVVAFIVGQFLIKSIGNGIPVPSNINAVEVENLRFLMTVMVINICIDFPTNVFMSNIIVREQYIYARLMAIVKQLLNPIVGIPLLLLGFGSASLVFATSTINIVYQVMAVWFCFKVLKIKFKFALPKIKFLKEIFTFSFFILINLLVDQINWSVDKNLLGIFCGTIQVGIYTNSDQLSNYFFSFASTISDVFTPKVHRLVAENKPNINQELTKLFVQVGRLQFMLLSLITIGFVTVGKPFVKFYADGQVNVYYTALILFLATFISAIQYQGISILQAKNMHKFKALLNFTVVFLNVAISIPLCIAFGAIGSALGTFISNLFINGVIINLYYWKKVKLDIPYFWRNIFSLARGLVLPIIAMTLITLFAKPSTLIDLLVYGVVIVIVYGVSMLKWGMNRTEKEFVFNLIEKIAAKVGRK